MLSQYSLWSNIIMFYDSSNVSFLINNQVLFCSRFLYTMRFIGGSLVVADPGFPKGEC